MRRMKSWRTHPAYPGATPEAAAPAATAKIPAAPAQLRDSPYAKPKPARITRRACLCCGREFRSEGIHNRLCGYCRRVDHQPAVW